jgi:hypothetical protein
VERSSVLVTPEVMRGTMVNGCCRVRSLGAEEPPSQTDSVIGVLGKSSLFRDPSNGVSDQSS